MPLVVPTFASTVDAMNNRMKARQEGKVPQGYLSDYDWNQYGRKLEAENKQIAAEQEAERQANPQPSGPTDPMLAASVQRRQRMLGGGPPPSTARPPDINDRPADYTDFKTKGWAMGSTARGRNAIGGVTNFPNMNDPGFGGYSGGGMRPAGSRTIGGRATPPAPDMFGRQFGQPDAPATDYEPGPAPMGTTTDGDNFGRLRMNAPKPYKPGLLGLAEGGEVEGPGGPKDDMVPAMLSDGEFIMPAEAVKFFGLDRLEKMKAKAKEGLMEMKASQPDTMHKGMMHMAAGGFVNPYADDPALYAMRQQEARDASLASAGITDMGGGNMTLNNRYGTGYAVPTTQGIPDMPGRFNNDGNTVTAAPGRGLIMVPDIVPSGPWAAPALPWEAQPQRENIAFMQRQMIPGAEGRRADDLATDTRQMALQPKGRRIITVPNANPFPYGDHGGTERTGFLAPWEKDAQAAAARNAPIQPFLDAGMKKSDIRKMMRTPQGMQTLQDMQPEQWTPIPGTDYMQGRKGQTVPMRRTGEQVSVPAGLEPESMTINGVRYAKPKAGTAPKPPKIVGTTEDESKLKFNMHEDGTRSVVGTPTPNDDQKLAAFKYMTGREINPASPADWSQAYYFATGRQPPEKAATQSSQPTREFKTPEEAMKAGLKPGDRVMVGGKMATWRE